MKFSLAARLGQNRPNQNSHIYIHAPIFYGYFHSMKAELCSFGGDHMVHKAKIICHLDQQKKKIVHHVVGS